jgi:hypothetical protein
MIDVLIQLMEAKTIKEIDEITYKNLDLISQEPFLLHCVNQSKRRIEMLEKIKKELWGFYLN